MNAAEILEKIGDSLGSTATVKSVFGEPVHAHGKTVVPIAKVAYGFGAGSGQGRHRSNPSTEPREPGEGGGGGGGVHAYPAGALEITADATRFVPFTDYRWWALAFGAGVLLGVTLSRRTR